MPKYTCDKCFVDFTRKVDYNKHIKTSCENNITKDDKTQLVILFKSCLNILRDAEALVGEKALRNLSYLLTLKLMEPHLGKNINIDDYDYKLEDIFIGNSNEDIKRRLNEQLSLVKFSNISKEKDEDLLSLFKDLWDEILSKHPKTKTIFQSNGGFDIKQKSTFRRLIDKLNSYDLFNTEYDILGHAYEDVIQATGTNSNLGQFFTLPPIKKFIVELLDPQVFPDGTIETIADPAMGTAGFLITSIKYIMDKAKNNKNPQNNNNSNEITLNWDFITKEGLYGKEISPDTYQLASSNMLISTGHLFDKLDNGDSLREPILKKFDIVLSNPPYGTKTLRYDEFQYPEKFQYVPIQSNNGVSLFIQAIIYMLKIGGRAGVLIPDGQDLYSTNNALMAVREYLIKTCDLKEVIYMPSGMFTYTNIKTCVLYFVKKIDDPFVKQEPKQEELGNKKKRQPKKIAISYNFVGETQTKEVSFYNFIPTNNSKKLLGIVSIEKIQENNYSWYYNTYIKIDNSEAKLGGEIIPKKLGEIFKLNGNGKTNSSNITNTGEYPFYKASCNNPSGTHSEYDFDGDEYLLVVKSGGSSSKPISNKYGIGKTFLVKGKCAANIAVFQLLPNDKSINIKYIYYYMTHIQNIIQGLAKYSTNNGNIDMKELMNIEIPVPPLDWQNYIVQKLDDIYEGSIKTLKESIACIKKCNTGYIDALTRNIENKSLGEVCEINQGKFLSKESFIQGDYKVIGGGKAVGFHNQYNRDANEFTLSRVGDVCIEYQYSNFWLTDNGFSLKVNNICENVVNKYIYYYIYHNKNVVEKYYKGAAQKVLSKSSLELIPIPIPSLERQNMIVKSLDEHNNHIMSSKNSIKRYKEEASNLLKILLEN